MSDDQPFIRIDNVDYSAKEIITIVKLMKSLIKQYEENFEHDELIEKLKDALTKNPTMYPPVKVDNVFVPIPWEWKITLNLTPTSEEYELRIIEAMYSPFVNDAIKLKLGALFEFEVVRYITDPKCYLKIISAESEIKRDT